MGDIVKKMLDQVPHRLLGLQVLLAANMTKTTVQVRLAIEANFLFSFF